MANKLGREIGTKSWRLHGSSERGTWDTTRVHPRTPFGQCIEEETPARGMTITALAKAAGINACNLHRSMTVGHKPTLHTVQALIAVLGEKSRLREAWEQTEAPNG